MDVFFRYEASQSAVNVTCRSVYDNINSANFGLTVHSPGKPSSNYPMRCSRDAAIEAHSPHNLTLTWISPFNDKCFVKAIEPENTTPTIHFIIVIIAAAVVPSSVIYLLFVYYHAAGSIIGVEG